MVTLKEAKNSVKSLVLGVMIIAVLVGIGFAGGYAYRQYKLDETAENVENDGPGLQLPGEVEKRVVTVDEVTAKLVEIGELATYEGNYSVTKEADFSRYFLDNIPVPSATNTIHLECDGIVKVGYSMDDITPTVDNDSQKIYIALPAPTVLDNYVIWDSVQCTEQNNFLNPIDFAQYQTLIREIESEGLAKVEADGIYDAAEENLKVIVRNFLAGFEDFEIVFL